jgi:hypothetical protein
MTGADSENSCRGIEADEPGRGGGEVDEGVVVRGLEGTAQRRAGEPARPIAVSSAASKI